MKKNLVLIILGILIGWGTVPALRAESAKDINHYIDALRRIITIMEQIQVTSQQTADNTKALRDHFGIK